jgi:hypothetical protein
MEVQIKIRPTGSGFSFGWLSLKLRLSHCVTKPIYQDIKFYVFVKKSEVLAEPYRFRQNFRT